MTKPQNLISFEEHKKFFFMFNIFSTQKIEFFKVRFYIILKQIINKTYLIRRKLSPMIYSTSLEMRKNLWQIFIMPLYEFILPIYHCEQATTKRNKMELALRNSFKSFTGLKIYICLITRGDCKFEQFVLKRLVKKKKKDRILLTNSHSLWERLLNN